MKPCLLLRLLALILTVMMILSSVSCGGDGSENTSESGSVTENAASLDETVSDSTDTSDFGEETSFDGTETETAESTESDDVLESTSEVPTDSESLTGSDTESATESSVESETWENNLEITEEDGVASVNTDTGLKCTADGYSSFDETGFVFTSGLHIYLGDAFKDEFNRFTMKYASTAPLKIYVTYSENGKECKEYFYLEAGEESFSAISKSFFSDIKAKDLVSISIDTCEEEQARFVLFDLTTEKVKVPDYTLFISGKRYTLGIDLQWGGTINYVSDNNCKIDRVRNLVNKHDTGRLIQQSYYGVSFVEGEYTPGSFGSNNNWPYNPVQGGGQGNYSSRLIDVVVEEDYVYIKAQPMDWGKINEITPSYMENTYTVADDYIRVDNRFVDFSGWEHPARGQELPALYTISYLDTFVWYGGAEPWTDGELSIVGDLPFWGDNNGKCSFTYNENNSETWSAFVNSDGSFGIGLYVPNIDSIKAGRHGYDTANGGSKSADADPCSYIAPINNIKMVSYEALEYSYLLAAGSVEEIRSTFKKYKDFTANDGLDAKVSNRIPYYGKPMNELDFTDSTVASVLTGCNSTTVFFDEKMGATKLTVGGSDPFVTLNFRSSDEVLYAEDYRYVEFEYMLPESNSAATYPGELFIATGDVTGASASRSLPITLTRDGEYHTLRVNVSDVDFWSGKINLLRFDYFNKGADGDVVYIKSFRLVDGRDVDTERIDFSTADGSKYIASAANTEIAFDESLSSAKLTAKGQDPSVTFSFQSMSADDYKTLKIRYMVPKSTVTTSNACDIFFCTGNNKNPAEAVRRRFSLVFDGEYHDLVIDLSEYDFWSGEIHKIRFDYFAMGVDGDSFYINSIELVKE